MNRFTALTFYSVLVFCSGCAPKPEPAIDQATVIANHASVRLKNSSTSRTLVTLEPGDNIEVLERQENWYRIRLGDVQGWMQESTVVTNSTRDRIQEMVTASQGEASQNTATLSEDANFRIEPGRTTPVIRRLPAGTKVEVIDRRTLPRPNTERSLDSWVKIRPSPTEVGWILSSLISYDVPEEIAQYTEGYIYSAVKPINQVQDSLAGPINWYVVAERSPNLDAQLDFNGIRVFTWNQKKHRYETAFRARGLRGVYPLSVGQDAGNPTFRFHELAEDGQTKSPQDFVMYGVIVKKKTT
jgi:SH3-like domain-containing protein